MTKILEDEFMEWQSDMVDITKEYIENRAEKIYLYGSIENGGYSFNLFFKINNQIVTMDQVNSVLNEGEREYDLSDDRQWAVLRIGTKDLQEIKKVCTKYEQPVPTQFKLYYDVQENSLKAKYQYDPIYSNTDALYSSDIFMSWYEEVKQEVEG
ncbi:hypothetical protein [Enterococcus ureasiticus]|uniref:DUF600 domain-containing protein n=1 Tax=Enterococcus ureasiticus TaxID=903984 RepID=A0A1E5GMX9_9ENTE|nr:hypothetical protein [Enterococcus ureasiticus]OEG14054.1 hypothetical protein BCR21_03420 [Enterococcus ureasiticus]